MRSDIWIAEVTVPGATDGPLAGTTFAVKDNIDVAGVPTTAGCPSFAYTPTRSAPVVQRLLDAGATVVGKANMDQFATGLTGTRSPYGIPRSVIDPTRISGGSSSGSAVAVAAGLATFALGTDTAGSGRVPAACNGIVGLKPTPGLLPIEGIVPACRSVDCPSAFTTTVAAARVLLEVLAPQLVRGPQGPPRLGVPDGASLTHLAPAARAAFAATVDLAVAAGADIVTVDLAPFLAAGDLLYGGAWVAERYAAVGAFIETHPDEVHPVVASIVLGGRDLTAAQAFADRYRLDDLARDCTAALAGLDALLLPTVPDVPTVEDVLADPVGTNAALGRYTTFVNLLGMCAVSIPGAPRADGVPAGVSIVARARDEHRALDVAAIVAGEPVPPLPPSGRIPVVVVGAHLEGQPLNHQLTDRGGRLERRTTTAPRYRLLALETMPPKPGLEWVEHGACIEVEVWSLPSDGFATFVALVPPPLAIGTVDLVDGTAAPGFVCEPRGLAGGRDITSFGGWRAYTARTD